MSSSGQLDSGDGSLSYLQTLRQFINADAERLLDRVDFAGIISHAARSSVLAVFLGLATIVVAIREAFGELGAAIRFLLTGIPTALTDSLVTIQRTAIAEAVGEVLGAGVLGLPVGVGTVLSSFLVLAFVVVLAWGPS